MFYKTCYNSLRRCGYLCECVKSLIFKIPEPYFFFSVFNWHLNSSTSNRIRTLAFCSTAVCRNCKCRIPTNWRRGITPTIAIGDGNVAVTNAALTLLLLLNRTLKESIRTIQMFSTTINLSDTNTKSNSSFFNPISLSYQWKKIFFFL